MSNITYEVVESSDDGEHADGASSYTLDGAQDTPISDCVMWAITGVFSRVGRLNPASCPS